MRDWRFDRRILFTENSPDALNRPSLPQEWRSRDNSLVGDDVHLSLAINVTARIAARDDDVDGWLQPFISRITGRCLAQAPVSWGPCHGCITAGWFSQLGMPARADLGGRPSGGKLHRPCRAGRHVDHRWSDRLIKVELIIGIFQLDRKRQGVVLDLEVVVKRLAQVVLVLALALRVARGSLLCLDSESSRHEGVSPDFCLLPTSFSEIGRIPSKYMWRVSIMTT